MSPLGLSPISAAVSRSHTVIGWACLHLCTSFFLCSKWVVFRCSSVVSVCVFHSVSGLFSFNNVRDWSASFSMSEQHGRVCCAGWDAFLTPPCSALISGSCTPQLPGPLTSRQFWQEKVQQRAKKKSISFPSPLASPSPPPLRQPPWL